MSIAAQSVVRLCLQVWHLGGGLSYSKGLCLNCVSLNISSTLGHMNFKYTSPSCHSFFFFHLQNSLQNIYSLELLRVKER